MSLRVETFPELCDVSNWRFKAEGDANIVLSFVGKNGEFRGVVLRLRKTDKIKNTTDAINVVNSNNQYIDQSYINSFIDIVMKPLIGKEYISNSILLEVPTEFLKNLSKVILSSRSQKRTHKDIDLNQQYAILTLDVTTFISKTITPILSVELKPKWGFLPTSSFINVENSVKFQSCRFCMHQWLKLKEKTNKIISEIGSSNCGSYGDSDINGGVVSGYCPLDLFSLNEKRLRKAISELLIYPKWIIGTFENIF